MKKRSGILIAVGVLALLSAGTAWSQHEHPEGAEHPTSPEDQAMMEAWQKAGTPGKPHAWMAKSAGTWKVKSTMWMAPDAEPMVSEGKAERKMILGGRVMVEKFNSTFMGGPFEGVAHSGYNNVTGKYWGTWTDSMSTSIAISTGECNKDHSRCAFAMTSTDPMTGDDVTMRIDAEFMGENSERHTFYETRDGSEFKAMELLYQRTMPSQAAREMKETATKAKAKVREMREGEAEDEDPN